MEDETWAVAELLYEVIRGEWPDSQDLDEIVLVNTDNTFTPNDALSAQLAMVRRFEARVDPERVLGRPADADWPPTPRG